VAGVRDGWRHSNYSRKHTGRIFRPGTLYGKADKKIVGRAINWVQREKRLHFHLND